MNSMAEILAGHAAAQPDRLFAADHAGNELTYGQAWKQILEMAGALTGAYGIGKGDVVMVECNQDVFFLTVNLACELVGAVFVPIESNASEDRKQSIREESGAKLWIGRNPLEGLRSVACEELLCDQGEAGTRDEQPMAEETAGPSTETGVESEQERSDSDGVKTPVEFPAADALAQLLYTTGTTGKSKGIMISNGANVALAQNIREGVQMKEGSVEAIPVPLSHSHGLRCAYANLLNGCTIVLMDGLLRVKKVFALMDRYHVTAMDLSPSAATLLIKVSKGAFFEYARKLDYIQLGTAALPEGLKEQLVTELPGVHLYNFYGSTESGRSCVLDFSVEKGRESCIGREAVNAQIEFTDDDRRIIRATKEEPGLLASKGSMNMIGYWKNPELTAEIMRDGYIFTNDLGYKDEDGFVYVLGRRDDVINCNGIKIAPDEIEEVAVAYAGVKDAACVPQKDELAGQVPKLFISLEVGRELDLKAYSEYLTEHLDGNKVPKRIEIIDEIPRTFNGKLKRKELVGR
ncbi:MAG: class I adenylate-forming enzyme family protein [Lachnospiraceae bacterium]|nr:class I adenylate-forming enzyme family protein [Lachnospiraceae bacterium]